MGERVVCKLSAGKGASIGRRARQNPYSRVPDQVQTEASRDRERLRQPTFAAALSATINLLCMRRSTLRKSRMKSSVDHFRLASGLKRLISTSGWASRAAAITEPPAL
jgi:hypothetical protein